jgi:hypothetical protein
MVPEPVDAVHDMLTEPFAAVTARLVGVEGILVFPEGVKKRFSVIRVDPPRFVA